MRERRRRRRPAKERLIRRSDRGVGDKGVPAHRRLRRRRSVGNERPCKRQAERWTEQEAAGNAETASRRAESVDVAAERRGGGEQGGVAGGKLDARRLEGLPSFGCGDDKAGGRRAGEGVVQGGGTAEGEELDLQRLALLCGLVLSNQAPHARRVSPPLVVGRSERTRVFSFSLFTASVSLLSLQVDSTCLPLHHAQPYVLSLPSPVLEPLPSAPAGSFERQLEGGERVKHPLGTSVGTL